MSMIPTKSRVYADVLQQMPESYYNYENFSPNTDLIDNYQLVKRLGCGKYSQVFEGLRKTALNQYTDPVVIKILKPVRKRKIYREIKILNCLRDGINIIKLHTVVSIPHSNHKALIFEKMERCEDFKANYQKFNQYDIKYYTYEVLKALDYCHSKGIMHRDVKPHNIIIDPKQHRIQLIDWGLAEFYRPGTEYNVRVASKFFKAPELLVDYIYYDYSLDIWSLGCMFASMIFRREPFFHGIDNQDQLFRIVEVLGSAEFFAYLKKYNIKLNSDVLDLMKQHSRKCWQRFITSECEYLIDNSALNFLESMLKFDHMERITAREALNHNYFDSLRKSSAVDYVCGCSTSK